MMKMKINLHIDKKQIIDNKIIFNFSSLRNEVKFYQ